VIRPRVRKSLGPLAFDFASYHPSTLSAWAAVLLRKSRSMTWTDIMVGKLGMGGCGVRQTYSY
jgi:hypothetical protein